MEKFEKYILEKQLNKINTDIECLNSWINATKRIIKNKKIKANEIVKKLLFEKEK